MSPITTDLIHLLMSWLGAGAVFFKVLQVILIYSQVYLDKHKLG